MKVVLCALLFLGVVGSTLAVECYSCSYSTILGTSGDENCGDPFMKTGIGKATCGGKCSKIISKSDGKTISVTRSCLSACVAADCVSALGVEACSTCCDGDLCNGAVSVTFSLVAMVAMVTSVWAFSQ